jgi:hypothetical protein
VRSAVSPFPHSFALLQGLLIKPLLEKVLSRRGGRLPGFLLVIGDEESDDKMVEVSTAPLR